MSRPSSSVPSQCAADGGCRRSVSACPVGGWVASQGAKAATSSSASDDREADHRERIAGEGEPGQIGPPEPRLQRRARRVGQQPGAPRPRPRGQRDAHLRPARRSECPAREPPRPCADRSSPAPAPDRRWRRNSSDARCRASSVRSGCGKGSRARASTSGDSSIMAIRASSSRATSPRALAQPVRMEPAPHARTRAVGWR